MLYKYELMNTIFRMRK